MNELLPRGDNGLQSQFETLRALPLERRRELLPGLQWREGKRHLGPLLFLIVMFTVMSVALAAIVSQSLKNQKAPQRPQVSARVVQNEIVATDYQNTQPQKFLKYRVKIQGRDYFGNTLLNNTSPFSNLQVGDTLEVNYDASDPNSNQPNYNSQQHAKAQEDFPTAIFLAFPFLMLMFVGPLFWPIMRVWFLARRLCESGNLAQGYIVWIRPHSPFSFPNAQTNPNRCEVFYRWMHGAEACEGKMLCDNLWLLNQWKVDAPVVVAYDAEKPSRSIVLEAFVR